MSDIVRFSFYISVLVLTKTGLVLITDVYFNHFIVYVCVSGVGRELVTWCLFGHVTMMAVKCKVARC